MRTANIIHVLPEIDQLSELACNQSDPSKITPLRQIIIERVLAASLEVDATIAQIDNEIAQSNEVRGYLSDKRDRAVNRANLLSIVSGGTLGATSAGLQLPSGENKASSIVGIAAGVLSSTLAISGIRAQKGGTRLFEFNSLICWPRCSIDRRSAIAAMIKLSGAFSTKSHQQTRKASPGRSALFRHGSL